MFILVLTSTHYLNSIYHVLHKEVETHASENELDAIKHSEYIDIDNHKTNCELLIIKYSILPLCNNSIVWEGLFIDVRNL